MSRAATLPRVEAAIPQFDQVLGHPAPLWMLFMSRVLGALRLLRHPLGARALHRRPVPRRRRERTGRRQPDVRRVPRAGVCRRDLRRLHRRQDHRLPALDSDRRRVHGRRALHDRGARSDGSSSSAWRPSSSATACSSRTSRRWSASSTRRRRAARLAASRSSTWGSSRARSSRRSSPAGWRRRCSAPTRHARLQVRVHRVRRRHARQPGVVLHSAARQLKGIGAPSPGPRRAADVCSTWRLAALFAIPVVYFLLGAGRPAALQYVLTALFVVSGRDAVTGGHPRGQGRARQGRSPC